MFDVEVFIYYEGTKQNDSEVLKSAINEAYGMDFVNAKAVLKTKFKRKTKDGLTLADRIRMNRYGSGVRIIFSSCVPSLPQLLVHWDMRTSNTYNWWCGLVDTDYIWYWPQMVSYLLHACIQTLSIYLSLYMHVCHTVLPCSQSEWPSLISVRCIFSYNIMV